MTQATTAVAVLLATWAFAIAPPNMKVLGNISIIVVGVVIASLGEIKFEIWGFVYQIGGIVTEALRLVMVQRLLSSGDFKMDPLVSLYYYAPACAVINSVFTLFIEGPRITMADIQSLGFMVLLANGLVAFFLNVSSVLLVRLSCSASAWTPKLTHMPPRLVKPRPWSLPCLASSKISFSSLRPCSSSTTPSRASNSLVTLLPSPVLCTTSLAPKRCSRLPRMLACNSTISAKRTPQEPRFWVLLASSSLSCGLFGCGVPYLQTVLPNT